METFRRFFQKFSLIPEIIICVLFFYLIWVKCGLWFETNDDLIINDLLRGAVTGKPEYHTIHNSVILTAPLSLLYRIAPSIPWWGGFLLLCNGLSIIVPIDAIVKKSNNLFNLFVCPAVYAICLLVTWSLRGRIQFTSTAMLLAIAGFVALVFYKNHTNVAVFGVCELLAYIIRPEGMEIIMPIGFGLWFVALSVMEEDIVIGIKKLFAPIGVALAIIGVGFVVQYVAYSGSEWEQSKEYEAGRTEMLDYSGVIEFDDINEIYKRGVTKEEYEAFTHSLVLDYENLAETVSAASYVGKANTVRPGITKTIKWIYVDSYLGIYDSSKWLLLTLIIAWGVLLITSILGRNIKAFVGFTAIYLFGKGITWGFIYLKGRMPERLMFPLYYLEIISIIAVVIILLNERREKDNLLRILVVPGIAVLAYVCFLAGRQQLKLMVEQQKSFPILREMESEISEYCEEHSDHKFILSTYIFSNYRRSVFDVGEKPEYIFAGGWLSSLPSVKARNSEYLEKGYIYLITTAESINGNVEAETAFLNQRYDAILKKEDTIDLATGGQAVVYRVR